MVPIQTTLVDMSSRTGLSVLLILVAGAGLASCSRSAHSSGSARAGPPGSTVPAHPSACDPSRMVALAGDWNGYAGGSAGFVVFSNAGHSACVFAGGYPEVALLGLPGGVIAPVSKLSPPGQPSFVLPPGGSVGARITMSDGVLGSTGCRTETANGLQITGPNGVPGTYEAGAFAVCTGMPSVAIGPIQALAGLTGF
jgi:hypothetical protein